jgi:hypothetical protein
MPMSATISPDPEPPRLEAALGEGDPSMTRWACDQALDHQSFDFWPA